jgi:hypothetical protein
MMALRIGFSIALFVFSIVILAQIVAIGVSFARVCGARRNNARRYKLPSNYYKCRAADYPGMGLEENHCRLPRHGPNMGYNNYSPRSPLHFSAGQRETYFGGTTMNRGSRADRPAYFY